MSAFSPNCEIVEIMKYMCLADWQIICGAPYLRRFLEKV